MELLTERHRHGVLQMRAAHLQHPVELPGLGKERLLQPGERVHVARKAQDQRQSERGRVDVVGRLPEVHVIVRTDVLVLAFPVAERFEREVRDHLVRVHVGRSSGAALDEIGDELVTHFAGDQPVAGAGDGIRDLRVEDSKVAIRQRGGFLDVAEGLDEVRLQRHRDVGDVEVLLPAQRLHAVVRGVRNHSCAEEILFDPGRHEVAPSPAVTARVLRFVIAQRRQRRGTAGKRRCDRAGTCERRSRAPDFRCATARNPMAIRAAATATAVAEIGVRRGWTQRSGPPPTRRSRRADSPRQSVDLGRHAIASPRYSR